MYIRKEHVFLSLKWLGAVTGMIGAVFIAMNLPGSGYGFIFFSVSAICWIIVGWHLREMSLVWLNVTFLAIDVLGIYRWILV